MTANPPSRGAPHVQRGTSRLATQGVRPVTQQETRARFAATWPAIMRDLATRRQQEA